VNCNPDLSEIPHGLGTQNRVLPVIDRKANGARPFHLQVLWPGEPVFGRFRRLVPKRAVGAIWAKGARSPTAIDRPMTDHRDSAHGATRTVVRAEFAIESERHCMKVEFINPFVSATLNVFKTMFATTLQRGQIFVRRPNETHGGLSGVIGLSGKTLQGAVAIVLAEETAITATERFLGTNVQTVTAEVVDCVGELVNMIAGNAKAQLEAYSLSLSLPSIVRGSDHLIEFPSNAEPIVCIPFDGDIGQIVLQVGFVNETGSTM
jgi:chemotaxis protein CheX